jgi:hypothetical protein
MTWSSAPHYTNEASFENYSNACTALDSIEARDSEDRFAEFEQKGGIVSASGFLRFGIPFPQSGGVRVIQFAESNTATETSPEKASVGITDVISTLKVALGLPTKDVAAILKVSRQTLYNYQRSAEAQNTMHRSTKERSLEVYDLIKLIRQVLPKSPGPLAKNVIGPDGLSLLDLLSNDSLDHTAISAMALELAKRMNKSAAQQRAQVSSQTLNELTPST